MKYIFNGIFFLISVMAYSNDTLQVRNNTGIYSLNTVTYFLTDSSAALTFDDIKKEQFSGEFQPLGKSKINGGSLYAYWFRISIVASDSLNNWWLILKNSSYSDLPNRSVYTAEYAYVDGYFTYPDGTLMHMKEGTFTPRREREVYVNPLANIFSVSVRKNDTVTMFIRVYNPELDELDISFEIRPSLSGIPADKGGFSFSITFLMGVIAMLGILCIFFFFASHDYANFIFGCFCFFLMFQYSLLHNEALFIRWLIPQKPWLASYFWNVFTSGLLVLFVLFGRYFVDLRHKSRSWDNIMKGFAIGLTVYLLFELLNTALKWQVDISRPFFGISFMAIIVIAIRIGFFQGYASKIYMLGAVSLLLSGVLGLLYNAGYFRLFNPWLVGQVGLMLIYTFGLAYKLKENERIKARQERKLEDARLIESAYTELKATQAQLIQSEKMASLGELTAGIAHEIQNPLNFVNNFSEVNTELIDEANQEIDKGHLNEAKTILSDLKENQQKINHHGKRADAIVKSMLSHSRTSSGNKEWADINGLCDEYLRLAYHGFRAKDKSFNAKFETQFDESIPKLNVVSQDIGRVVLNLINNAFYAVSQRRAELAVSQQRAELAEARPDYEPTVSVSTKMAGDKVLIIVKDNGSGIPEHIKEKIFQPFFTTKPTGQGTGLGLSLSYDIIKAHGGELKVETNEKEGSTFIIRLPV